MAKIQKKLEQHPVATLFPAPDAAAFLTELLQKAMANESPERLVIRLKAAISQFDHASIYTIHGFCQRVLQDFAFYCQVPFSLEMDEEQHHKEVT